MIHHPRHGSSGVGRVGAAVALLTLLAWGWRHVSRAHRDRMQARPARLPERLEVWEGEGGQNPMSEALPAEPLEAAAEPMPGARAQRS